MKLDPRPATFIIINDQQIPMFVKLIRKGECYGLEDCLTHKEDDPLVEFYSTKFDPSGYFISRYSLSSLRGDSKYANVRRFRDHGLCLQGDMRVYDIDQCAAEMIMRWLDLEVPPTNTKP